MLSLFVTALDSCFMKILTILLLFEVLENALEKDFDFCNGFSISCFVDATSSSKLDVF